MSWKTNGISATKSADGIATQTRHSYNCSRAFKNYDLSCARCRELAEGFGARKGWSDDRRQADAGASTGNKTEATNYTYHAEMAEGHVSAEFSTYNEVFDSFNDKALTGLQDWQPNETSEGKPCETATLLYHDCPCGIIVRVEVFTHNPIETAYDYTRQIWVTGPEALEIRDEQLRKELAGLTSNQARSFRQFLGMSEKDGFDAVVRIKTELAAIAQRLAEMATEEDTL